MSEKKLVLLGLLRSQDMHGYQLSEILTQASGVTVRLSKANAYKLLKQMEADGWVDCYKEQAGNRPVRRVYAVTGAGEKAFQMLLRENLALHQEPEFPNFVGLNFLEQLPADEAALLLQTRRRALQARWQRLNEVSADMRRLHVSLDFLYRYYSAELAWTDEVIERLKTQ